MGTCRISYGKKEKRTRKNRVKLNTFVSILVPYSRPLNFNSFLTFFWFLKGIDVGINTIQGSGLGYYCFHIFTESLTASGTTFLVDLHNSRLARSALSSWLMAKFRKSKDTTLKYRLQTTLGSFISFQEHSHSLCWRVAIRVIETILFKKIVGRFWDLS